MTTPSDSVMADHELQSFGKEWVLVKIRYFQPSLCDLQVQVLAGPWKITDVVALSTLIQAGLRVEIIA